MKTLRYAGRQYKYNFNFGLSTTFIYKADSDEILMSFWGELSEKEAMCAVSGYNQGNQENGNYCKFCV